MASELPAEWTQEAAPRCLAGEFTMRSICAVSALDGFPRAPTFAGRSGNVVRKLRELSPLYEMVKEGIDLSKIEWAAH